MVAALRAAGSETIFRPYVGDGVRLDADGPDEAHEAAPEVAADENGMQKK